MLYVISQAVVYQVYQEKPVTQPTQLPNFSAHQDTSLSDTTLSTISDDEQTRNKQESRTIKDKDLRFS
jgi:hypothetical protein